MGSKFSKFIWSWFKFDFSEFGDFFYKNKPLSSKLYPPVKTKSKPGVAGKKASSTAATKGKKKPLAVQSKEEVSISEQAAAEQAAAEALDKLKAQQSSHTYHLKLLKYQVFFCIKFLIVLMLY